MARISYKSEGSGLYWSLLYDEVYKKLRRSGKTPSEAHRYAFKFCKCVEKKLTYLDDTIDALQVINGIIDYFDPQVSMDANLAVLESYISIDVEFDERTALLREIDYLQDLIGEAREFGDLDAVKELENELKKLKLKLKRFKKKKEIAKRKKKKFKVSETPLFLKELPVLRDYQREALDCWFKTKKGVIVLPPGSGKSIIGMYAVNRLGSRTLIVVPTIELLRQWLRELRRYFTDVGCFYGECKDLGRITVITYASLTKHQGLIYYYDFLIFDEIHHLAAEKYSTVLEKLDGKTVMGLTSTPEREDNRHLLLNSKVPIVYRRHFADLRDWLSGIEIIPIKVKLVEEELKALKKIERKIRYVSGLLYSFDSEDEDYREVLRVLMNLSTIKRVFLSEIESKIAKAVEIAKEYSDERVLIFTESIKSCELIAKKLREKNVKAQPYHSLYKPSLRLWGKDFNVLVAVRCLDEGLDVPACKLGILVSSSKSLRQLTQRLGRLLRPYKNMKAKLYALYSILDEWRVVTRLKALAFER